ncbi:prolyl oligopeptidase family serine peptidase [Asticcacaulis sp. BYS171W]|uniref:Prolyl oligopeptidase family serine peptidase n=1 Tax=Asticcacaulis aquaticus TaxID=2984212 RepID=A0ABT5HU14_9CAUL|nr:prolyl oligopeptidase family serine peptidase [Asticcacaulis aquaticus]MDC7683438.1 prolyl oligopeptidase family serine peptidase [Asticcacaulis aquaticus]
MALKPIFLAVCLSTLSMGPVTQVLAQASVTAPDPRAVKADMYLPGKVGALITDLDIRARFTGGGKGVIYRLGAKGAGRIVHADSATGTLTDIVTEATLTPMLTAQGVKIEGVADVRPLDYDADKKVLKLAVNGREWLYEAGALKPVIPPAKDDGLMSPDGKSKIIARNYNLWLVDVATGRETALTTDGSYDRRYGQNYPLLGAMAAANSETPDARIAAQWSADSQKLVTYRMDRNGSYIWHAVQQNPPGSQFPREFSYVYPTAGAKDVPQIHPLVIDVAAAGKGGLSPVKLLDVPSLSLLWPGDPPIYWDESGKVIYEWQARGYGEITLYEVDPVTGKADLRVREALKPLVTVTSSGIRNAPELGGYLVISERSNWAQLYFIKRGEDPNGGKALTKGAWEVTEINHVAKDGVILITGIGREAGVNPYFKSLYRVTLDGKISHLTPEPLDHEVKVSDDGQWIIDRMSSPTVPTKTVLRRAVDGAIVAELGRADPSVLLATGFTPPEPFETLADDGKTKLYGMIYRPANFDPSKSYAVIENVYTGPTTHRFGESYEDNVVASTNALAQYGAIVVTIDGRGTSQRGKVFRLPAYQNLGEVGLDDHIHVLKAMKAKYPYFDLNRVGVYGGSAGGYDTARFLLRRPDFYKVGVASSGNHDLRLDKAWWPEVSMGIADDATWERNSNISVAKNLKGKLMLIHGDIDDNVPVAASLRLSEALIKAGKPHELVILPNTNHAVFQPYYWDKLTGYFVTNLIDVKP